MYNQHVSVAKIVEYDLNIDSDTKIPDELKSNSIIREVCRCGLWLAEQLQFLDCPEFAIHRIQEAAGGLSFGRDPWETHKIVLEAFKNNDFDLEFKELN